MTVHTAETTSRFIEVNGLNIHYHDTEAVSYTHLTLPTTPYV